MLLGLPGLYAGQRRGMGRLGLVGLLTAFSGTYLIAVTGNFGFLAPVLAKQSPAVLDSIGQYLPVLIINGLAASFFMIGYLLFGVAMIRTATLPRWSASSLLWALPVVLMASAPWVPLQPDQDVRTEPNRWFLTVAGSVDAITAGVLLALARRLRRTLLVLELAGAVILAGAIILPFQPTFAAILAIGVVPLIAYQYWRDVRMLHMPRLAGICRPNGPALD